MLHVDADEVPQGGRVVDQAPDVLVGELLVEQETEVRQLQRDVDAQAALGDPVQDPLVLRDDRARLVRGQDVLAQQRRVRVRGRSR